MYITSYVFEYAPFHSANTCSFLRVDRNVKCATCVVLCCIICIYIFESLLWWNFDEILILQKSNYHKLKQNQLFKKNSCALFFLFDQVFVFSKVYYSSNKHQYCGVLFLSMTHHAVVWLTWPYFTWLKRKRS